MGEREARRAAAGHGRRIERGSPRVSVVITVRDGRAYLDECLASVLSESDVDLEVIVVDDGSVDGSAEAATRHADPRVTIDRRPPRGRGPALATGLDHARGAYVAILDADDARLTGGLARQVELLDRNPDVVAVGGSTLAIDACGATLGVLAPAGRDDPALRRAIGARRAPFHHGACLFRKDALDEVGGYDPGLACWLDLDLYVRIVAAGKLAAIDDVVLARRFHAGQYFGRPAPTLRESWRRWRSRVVVTRRAKQAFGRPRSVLLAAVGRHLHAALHARLRRGWIDQPVGSDPRQASSAAPKATPKRTHQMTTVE